jgi:hypothetical protein
MVFKGLAGVKSSAFRVDCTFESALRYFFRIRTNGRRLPWHSAAGSQEFCPGYFEYDAP